MNVIEIIPLKRGILVERLSYFSSTDYPIGSIVETPLRSKTVFGIVAHCEPVSVTKTALRAATFSLRKLPAQEHSYILSSALIKTAQVISKSHPAEIGAILHALLPTEIRNGERTLPKIPSNLQQKNNIEAPSPTLLQSIKSERYIAYLSIIREAFAHGGTVLFVVPTSSELNFAREMLSKGIEDRVIFFTHVHGKKELSEAYKKFEDYKKSKLIITTPAHAYLDRHDITRIIVEGARSTYYTMRNRPHLDHREILALYASENKRDILYGDILPRSEEEEKRRSGVFNTYGEHPKRLALPTKLIVLRDKTKPVATVPFPLLTSKLIEAMQSALSKKGHVFLHSARRGLAPVVVCIDCGFIFRCPDSGSPYSLIKTVEGKDEKRWFLSSATGKRVSAAEVCSNCGGWRLREFGIGIQNIYDFVCKTFPDTKIVLFDHTTAKTFRRAEALMNEFYKAKGTILIGTDMSLTYLKKPVSISAITSMDALVSNPTWRNQENICGLLLTLRELTTETVYVQTRSEIDEIVAHAQKGSVEQFYTEELALRKSLHYPPYAVFIFLTWRGKPEIVKKFETEISEKLKAYKLLTYNAPLAENYNEIKHGLIRLPRTKWPDKNLITLLKSLPPSIQIVINPDRIV